MTTSPLRPLLIGIAGALLASDAAAGDWIEDWFDQAVTTVPGSIQTQQRGYYTGGSFQARWRMSNDYLISASPPRFSAGCGGVDLFAGGFSFMDPEFLVQKLERSIQAAPAIAFQMAMSEYCKVCTDAMTTMEQITDALNSMQLNDCRLAKGIAAIPVKGDTSILKGEMEKLMQGFAISTGQAKNAQGVDEGVVSSGGKAPVKVSDMVEECPAVFKTVFTGGSVVENIADLLGLREYAPLMRGLIGDVYVGYDATYENYSTVPVQPCKGNDPGDHFDFINGKVEKKAAGLNGACSVATSTSVQEQIENRLTGIATKLESMGAGGAGLDVADRSFIAAAPFPVLNLLRDAVKGGYVDEAVNSARDILAPAYAAHMLNDVHMMTRLVFSTADEVQARANQSTTNPVKCNADFLKPVFVQLSEMDERAMRFRQMAVGNYQKALAELNANLQYATYLQKRREQGLVNDTTKMR